MRKTWRALALCVCFGACGGDDDGGSGSDAGGDDVADASLPDAMPGCEGPPALTKVVVATGLDRPVFLTAPEGDARLFVLEQHAARIRIIDGAGELVETPFLDLGTVAGGGDGGRDEQGLLGLAFHPDYGDNGRFFVAYSEEDSTDYVIAEYAVSMDDADVADPSPVGELLRVGYPEAEHYSGLIGFGPDGYLYAGLGDGSDPPEDGIGQDTSSLRATMVRLDVGTGPGSYGPAPGNPFLGDATADERIWAYGLRMPWRWSFDRQTGDLYIADVGANSFEEVNVVAAGTGAGANYGWDVVTGRDDCYGEDTCDTSGMVGPTLQYEGDAVAVMGGYVYRGSAMPCLQGTYFYGDYVAGWVKSFLYNEGQAVGQRTWDGLTAAPEEAYVSFGQDGAGELYLLDLNGSVLRIAPLD